MNVKLVYFNYAKATGVCLTESNFDLSSENRHIYRLVDWAYFEMLGDIRTDSGLELYFTEIIGGHVKEVIKTADMFVDRKALSHFY